MSTMRPRIGAQSKGSDANVPRKEVVELRFRAGHLRAWEDTALSGVLLVYYCFAKAVHEVVRTGSIAEAAAEMNMSKRSIGRANAVGAHTVEWFLEKWTHRSERGERFMKRDIESLAMTTPSKERAVVASAKAQVHASRKIEVATRRDKGPLRPFVEGEAQESSTKGPASGIFPSHSKLAKTRPRKIDEASRAANSWAVGSRGGPTEDKTGRPTCRQGRHGVR
jgi:hypothetical protein